MHYKDLNSNLQLIENSLLMLNDLVKGYERPEFADFLEIEYIGFSQMQSIYKKRKANCTD